MRFVIAWAAFFLVPTEWSDCFTIPTIRTTIIRNNIHRLNVGDHAKNVHEFDYLLREVSSNDEKFFEPAVSRRQIALTDSYDIRRTTLASSFPMTTSAAELQQEAETDASDDPYANVLGEQVGKIQKFQEQKETTTIESRLKSMDLQDIILTLFIPGVIAFVGFRWVFNRASGKVSENKEMILDSFAKEMLYHDGDYKEMELCINDYKKKLVWMGPLKNDAMLKSYLEY